MDAPDKLPQRKDKRNAGSMEVDNIPVPDSSATHQVSKWSCDESSGNSRAGLTQADEHLQNTVIEQSRNSECFSSQESQVHRNTESIKENIDENVESSKMQESQTKDLSDDINSRISYDHAASYWNNVPATVNGMLGGFAHISSTDIKGSESFLKLLFKLEDAPGRTRSVDCGAGIGRITKLLLQRHFGKVDLVEQCPAFANKAREAFAKNPKLGEVYCMGLQDFAPTNAVYDVIWVQWVIIYLPDQALVDFFRRMGRALRPGGVVVVKENFTSGGENDPSAVILDEEDSSVTRPLEVIIALAEQAGLKLIRSVQQRKFPKHLFKVFMLAFRPQQYSK